MLSRRRLKYVYLALKLVVGGFGIWTAWQAFGDKPDPTEGMYRHAFTLGAAHYELTLPDRFIAESEDLDAVVFLIPDTRSSPRLTLSARPPGQTESYPDRKELRGGKLLHYNTERLPNGNGPQHEQIRGWIDMADGHHRLYVQADAFAELDGPHAEELLRYLHLLKAVSR